MNGQNCASGLFGDRKIYLILIVVTLSTNLCWGHGSFGNRTTAEKTTSSVFRKRDFGYMNVTRAGILKHNESNKFTISVVNGIHVDRRLGTGLGVGWDNYEKTKAFPIFLDIRADLQDKSTTAFIAGDLGYTLMWLDSDKGQERGGVFFNIGFGLKAPTANALISALFEVGYKNQKADGVEYDQTQFGNRPSGKYTSLNFFYVTAGLMF
jgi:hypothetical protein